MKIKTTGWVIADNGKKSLEYQWTLTIISNEFFIKGNNTAPVFLIPLED